MKILFISVTKYKIITQHVCFYSYKSMEVMTTRVNKMVHEIVVGYEAISDVYLMRLPLIRQ